MVSVGAAIVGGWGLEFLWPKKTTGFGALVDVSPAKVLVPGANPVHITEGRFWLANMPQIDGLIVLAP